MNTDFGVAMIERYDEDEWRSTEKGIISNVPGIKTNNFEIGVLPVCKGAVIDEITKTSVIAILEGYDHAMNKEWEAIKVFLVADSKAIRRSRKD